MAADINDKLCTNYNNDNPRTARVVASRVISDTDLQCDSLTGWSDATPVHFATTSLDDEGNIDTSKVTTWKGIVSGDTITQMVRTGGAVDTGNQINDVVKAIFTAANLDDIVSAMQVEHNPDGSMKKNYATDQTVDDLVGGRSFIVSETGIVAQTSGLVGSMSNITYYMSGIRYEKSGISNKTYTASVDTYVFIDKNGLVTYSETTIGGAAPTAPVDSILVAVVTTGASVISSISMRNHGAVGSSNVDFTTFGYISARKPLSLSLTTSNQTVETVDISSIPNGAKVEMIWSLVANATASSVGVRIENSINSDYANNVAIWTRTTILVTEFTKTIGVDSVVLRARTDSANPATAVTSFVSIKRVG